MSIIPKVVSKLKKFYANYLDQIDKKREFPVRYSFIMHEVEKDFLTENIKNSKNYLEFGMGGSTFHVLKNSKAVVYSIDSSKDWLEHIKSFKFIQNSIQEGRLFLNLVDIGPTKSWGFPLDSNDKKLFPAFSSYIFSEINPAIIDTVLIDGRFRVACALKTILECKDNPNLKILIHDFTFRDEYKHVFEYLDEVKRVDSLILLKIKNDIDLEKVKLDYEMFKYLPD